MRQPQPVNTAMTTAQCPICTGEQVDKWEATSDFSFGVAGRDPVGHFLGNANAKKIWYLVGGPAGHRGDEKQTLCGRVDHWDFYDASGDEADWNIYIVPSARYSFIIDQVRDHRFDIDGKHHVEMDEVHTCNGERCLEAEITPDESFYRNPYFDRTYEPQLPLGGVTPVPQPLRVKPSPLMYQEICTYGPWVMDGGHGFRPEIHPSELFWWRERAASGAYVLMLLQDDSNRFDRVTDYYYLSNATRGTYSPVTRPAVDWSPWSRVPRTGEFLLAFSASTSDPTFSLFTIEETHARHVVTAKSAEFREDSDDGTEHNFEFDGTLIARVTETQPDDHVGVRFVQVCRRQSDNRILGYVSLRSQVGEDDRGKEGYLVLRVDFAKLPRP